MADLKDVAGSLITGRKMEEGNILEFFQLAEKYRAQRMKELCCDFILENIKTLPKELLAKLYKALTESDQRPAAGGDGRLYCQQGLGNRSGKPV